MRAKVWLAQAPVAGAVDRRNAVFLQVLMILMGCAVPLNWLYLRMTTGFSDAPGFAVDRAMGLAIAAVAWICLALVRFGRFRRAVRCFLVAEVLTQAIAFAATGLRVQLSDPTVPILIVVLGGLMLGRRTLWTLFGLLLAMFALGAATDVLRALERGSAWRHAIDYTPSVVVRYFLIVVVIDRCLAALRESLGESMHRGRQLARANRRLREEMREREKTHGQLVHAQKMEAVGRLAGGIAHDFNHVLSVVLGYAGQRERLADGGSAPLLRAMAGIETAARRGVAISRKLLGLSRQDVVREEVFDAGEALRELAPMLEQLFGGRFRLRLDLVPQPTPIRFDRGQFDLLVLNVAANARDAMQPGGCFALRTAPLADRLRIELQDDGCGMDEAVRARVFEPFFTTKPAGSGTGLGLSMARDLVVRAGGAIDVTSEPGAGTVLGIDLPRAALSPAGPACDPAQRCPAVSD